MVKVITGATPKGPEIVTLADLTRPAASIPTSETGSVSVLQTATEGINTLDKYISLADRGIGLLGRMDSVLQRVQEIQLRGAGPGSQQRQAPGPEQFERVPPGGSRINADPPQDITPEPVPSAIPAMITPEMAARLQKPSQTIPVEQIIQVLAMVEQLQPGITVAELKCSVEKQPEAIQRLLNVYASAIK